jgi:hypothetical protein
MAFEGIMKDYTVEAKDIAVAPKDVASFCQDWAAKYRPIAVVAQGMLKALYPPAAMVLGALIGIADTTCHTGG